MKERIQQAADRWKGLDLNKKVMFGIAGAVAVTATAAAVNFALTPTYTPYSQNISKEAMPSVLAELDANNIGYQITSSGQLLVDQNLQSAANSVLAKGGFPESDVTGYAHLLKEQTIYTSQIKENLFNSQVLEEEISKLIMQINGVESAKVKLALSKESQFLRDAAPAKASVIVNLKPNASLSRKQVSGIVNLVSSGIPNLEPHNVVILDQTGRMLSTASDDVYAGTPQLEYKISVESRIEQKVTSIVAPIVGMDALRVNVGADINFDRVEETSDTPVDKSVLVSEQVERDLDDLLGGGQGVPGALSNQPPQHAKFDDKAKSTSTDNSSEAKGSEKYTKNYDVGRSVKHVQKAGKTIERVSIAVLLDRSFFESEEQFLSVSEQVKTLISSSVGIKSERGDIVTVSALEFKKPAVIEPEPEEFYETEWFTKLIEVVKWLSLGTLFWLAIWRPLLHRISPPIKKESGSANNFDNMTDDEIMAMTNGAFDFDAVGGAADEERFRSEQNAAYLVMERKQDLVYKIFDGWLNGVDFKQLATQNQTAESTFSEVVSADEEEMMAAMMEEAMASEGKGK